MSSSRRWLPLGRPGRAAVALLPLALLGAACSGGDGNDGSVAARTPVSAAERTDADRSEDEPADEDGHVAGEDPDEAAEAPAPTAWTVPPAPLSQPTRAGCSSIVSAPASLQDAIDAIADRRAPHVLCLEGTFIGGGAPVSEQRHGIGPYYGGVVVQDRSNLTIRGLPGARILGVANDRIYPGPEAPPEAQGGNDKSNLVKVVDSDHIVLEWLDIDGRVVDAAGRERDGLPTLNRLVWFQNVTDSSLRYSRVQHAGGECVRLKANSQRNEVHHNVIADCGYYQFKVQQEERLQKNGEAVYIGTDPAQIAVTQVNKQRYWGLDPALVTDRSSYNRVHHNLLRPGPEGADWGNECVDVKEDWPMPQSRLAGDEARGEPGWNVIADNDCAGQFDPESGAFASRGPNTTFEHNLVSGTVKGAAIRIGAKDKDVGTAGTVEWRATGNVVRLNRLESFDYDAALKVFDDQPLAEVCGNVDREGRTDFGGDFANEPDAATNRARCPGAREPAGPRGPVGVPVVND